MADIATEADFVNAFSARLEAEAESASSGAGSDAGNAGNAGAGGAAAGKDKGTAAAGAAASDTTTETDTADPENADEEIASPAGAGDDSGDDDGAGTSTENGEGDDPAATDGDPEDAAKGTTDDGEEEDAAATDAATAKTFLETMKKHGLKQTLADLPKEMHGVAKAALDNMQAAFTRSQMEATSFRKERATFQAEQRFRDEHPEMAIAELLVKHPDLIEQVNALVEKTADTDKAKLFDIEVKDARKKALDAVTEADAKIERSLARADQIETYTKRACSKLNLPYDAVVNAVVLALHEKPEATRDLTEQELDAVISNQARVLKRHTSAVVREERKKVIVDRAKDRRTTSPAVRAGSGARAATPTGQKKATNDREFIDQMVSKNGR